MRVDLTLKLLREAKRALEHFDDVEAGRFESLVEIFSILDEHTRTMVDTMKDSGAELLPDAISSFKRTFNLGQQGGEAYDNHVAKLKKHIHLIWAEIHMWMRSLEAPTADRLLQATCIADSMCTEAASLQRMAEQHVAWARDQEHDKNWIKLCGRVVALLHRRPLFKKAMLADISESPLPLDFFSVLDNVPQLFVKLQGCTSTLQPELNRHAGNFHNWITNGLALPDSPTIPIEVPTMLLQCLMNGEALLHKLTDSLLGNSKSQLQKHDEMLKTSMSSSGVTIKSATAAMGTHKKLHEAALALATEVERVCGVLAVQQNMVKELKELKETLDKSAMLTSAWGLFQLRQRPDIADEVKGKKVRKAMKDIWSAKVEGHEEAYAELLGSDNMKAIKLLFTAEKDQANDSGPAAGRKKIRAKTKASGEGAAA